MASTTALCLSWKRDIGKKVHEHGVDTFKLALYLAAAANNKNTTAYGAGSEVAISGGYAAKGVAVTSVAPVNDGDVTIYDWADPTFSGVTIANIASMLMINTSAGDASVFVYNLAAAITVTAGNLIFIMPAAAAATALIRFP